MKGDDGVKLTRVMCDECDGGEHYSGSLLIAESFFKESLGAPKSSLQFIINYEAVNPHQHHLIVFSSSIFMLILVTHAAESFVFCVLPKGNSYISNPQNCYLSSATIPGCGQGELFNIKNTHFKSKYWHCYHSC